MSRLSLSSCLPMSSRLPISLRGVSVLLVLLPTTFWLTGCKEEAPAAPEGQPVRVVSVGSFAGKDALTATGLIRARDELPLAFKTGGIIRELRTDAGRNVRAGEVLAALEMPELDAQVTQAEESLAKAERDLARAVSLRERGLIALQAEQDALTQRDVAAAGLKAARFNREHAVITAPSDGVVLQKLAEARETVAPGQPVLVLGRADRGWVLRTGLPDRDAVRMRIGDAATVTLDAWPGRTLQGRVSRVAAASDARTGTVDIDVALPATELRLVSGLVGRLSVQAAPATNSALTVPLGALLEGNAGDAHVFVLSADGKNAQRRNVKTGALRDGQIEIASGLEPGLRVVSEGAAWLNDGDAIRLVP